MTPAWGRYFAYEVAPSIAPLSREGQPPHQTALWCGGQPRVLVMLKLVRDDSQNINALMINLDKKLASGAACALTSPGGRETSRRGCSAPRSPTFPIRSSRANWKA